VSRFSWTGTIPFDRNISLAELPQHLLQSLRGVEAESLTLKGNRLTFRGGVFRPVSSGNVLAPFGSGSLIVEGESHQLRYEVSFLQFISVVSAYLLVVALLFLFSHLLQFLWLVLLGVILVSVGNLALGIYRFSTFLFLSLASAPRQTAVPSE
jgi:hypothetical protein